METNWTVTVLETSTLSQQKPGLNWSLFIQVWIKEGKKLSCLQNVYKTFSFNIW